MQSVISCIVFVLLTIGGFFIFGIKLPRRKNIVSISKATVKDKLKAVDEKFSKLSLSEKIYIGIKNTVEMSGIYIALNTGNYSAAIESVKFEFTKPE